MATASLAVCDVKGVIGGNAYARITTGEKVYVFAEITPTDTYVAATGDPMAVAVVNAAITSAGSDVQMDSIDFIHCGTVANNHLVEWASDAFTYTIASTGLEAADDADLSASTFTAVIVGDRTIE